MIATAKHRPATFADLHKRLGEVPLERIRATPAPGTATEANLLVAGKPICELIDGVLVEKPMGTRESLLTADLGGQMMNHVHSDDLGVVLGPDGHLRLQPGLLRASSLAFIPWSAFAGERIPENDVFWSVAPMLAVEVLRSSNTTAEIDRKLRELFHAGCKLVWVIDPITRSAKMYSSPMRFKAIDETGLLDGGKVLPGFTLSLVDLFDSMRWRKTKLS